MDTPGRRVDALRILGNVGIVVGLVITSIGLATDTTPVKAYFFAALLVAVGIGFRLEAALTEGRSLDGPAQTVDIRVHDADATDADGTDAGGHGGGQD